MRQQKKEVFVLQTKLSYDKVLLRKSISNKNEKTQILMNKPVNLGLSTLEISKVLMYEFWYDNVKPKYGRKAKLCYKIQVVSLSM